MGLDIQKIARQGAAVGFRVVGGVLKEGTLRVNSNTTYNPVTDEPTGGSTDYTLQGLFYQSREQQAKDSSANTGMMMFEVAAAERAGLEAKPDEADLWIMDGVTWSIVRSEVDPAGAVYLIQITK